MPRGMSTAATRTATPAPMCTAELFRIIDENAALKAQAAALTAEVAALEAGNAPQQDVGPLFDNMLAAVAAKRSAPAAPSKESERDAGDPEPETAAGRAPTDAFQVSEDDADGSEEEPTNPKGKRTSKPAQTGTSKKPKAARATSAWDMFLKSKLKHARDAAEDNGEAYTDTDAKATEEKAAVRWKGLPEDRKAIYKDRAAEENKAAAESKAAGL